MPFRTMVTGKIHRARVTDTNRGVAVRFDYPDGLNIRGDMTVGSRIWWAEFRFTGMADFRGVEYRWTHGVDDDLRYVGSEDFLAPLYPSRVLYDEMVAARYVADCWLCSRCVPDGFTCAGVASA